MDLDLKRIRESLRLSRRLEQDESVWRLFWNMMGGTGAESGLTLNAVFLPSWKTERDGT